MVIQMSNTTYLVDSGEFIDGHHLRTTLRTYDHSTREWSERHGVVDIRDWPIEDLKESEQDDGSYIIDDLDDESHRQLLTAFKNDSDSDK